MTNPSRPPDSSPSIFAITDRNHLDYFLPQQYTLAAAALEVHGKADIRWRLVLVALVLARRRAPGTKPVLHWVPHWDQHWGPQLGNLTDDLATFAAGAEKEARDHTAGIAVAGNVVLAAAPCWNGWTVHL